jgi:type II secretory pathway pseudopilin PulG
MLNLAQKKRYRFGTQKGISIPELVIVLLVIAIISVLALPQILSSRRLFRFAGMQQEIVTYLREAREQAMAQRSSITFRYDHARRTVILYGGRFGSLGDSANRTAAFDTFGVSTDEIIYGRPPGAALTPLGDGTNMTPLTDDEIEITFRSDGSVLDASNNPVDSAIFFYHNQHRRQTAFAVSILGSGGRIKLWRYSERDDAYVE